MQIKVITEIIDGTLIDGLEHENNEIKDFETVYKFVKNKQTAYFSPNKTTWWKELGRNKNAPDGNDLIDRNNGEIGLIITENYINDLKYKIPQIIVTDSVRALKMLAVHIRNQYKNPLIAITGSMGKSSTRLLISALLQNFHVLENRGNNNVRAAIYANMLKLIQQPDFAVIETSLNAINNKENTAINLKPDIAIVTGIGAAHFSTINSIKQIAELKARIFKGLNSNGVAIINADTMYADYLKEEALKQTTQVQFYSKSKETASDINVTQISYHKGHIEFSLNDVQDPSIYKINTISEGMISNSLAAIAVLKTLKIPINKNYLASFKPFSKILAMKAVHTPTHSLTLLDDTHNASLPAMLNAIAAFNSQTQFFTGNKIIAIGKINDLGHKSREIHNELVDVLTQSNADYILCLDDDLRPVVNKVKHKHITWYPDKDLLLHDLKFLCNKDSLTLLKSSSGGTEFPEIAKKLPMELQRFSINKHVNDLFAVMSELGKSYVIVDNKTNAILESYNTQSSMTIEGMGPLLYYLKCMDEKLDDYNVEMQEWPTNNKHYCTGKRVTLYELLESMTSSPHPSEIYELSNQLFKTFSDRKHFIQEKIKSLRLNQTIATNLTGRFRIKERQSYTVYDLLNIYQHYKYDLFRFNNSFILGLNYKSGFIRGETTTIIFTSYTETDELKGKIN
ncbi:Mur ligase family protein [Staphylococcus caeli]|uniref:UDP-N-acetylmuramoyl-tripeptide--D-alanyl-D-alanine ligase n=1 Tax=Staphylococcus caeli TaxID=2201815 RepID=A0A1D4MQ70_9STAP|nr:Mur ligase family protein [Staphylococcus caeli]SCT00600.1 UDP-N-acetylmuramoyl-tripeptide--D-alanyl-D-alanine ligase [Staphylococcus caeli]SCT22500.1 UDP-N-acetylmuramoyl-tripeptide--D-alanyl-D-alanine ligase [Staphylococcus caeli]